MPQDDPRPESCRNCKKPCSVFFTQIVNGESGKIAMCGDCPKAKALLDPSQLGLLSQLTDLAVAAPVATGEKCPVCGFTPADFKKLNRFGCPHCYEYLAGFLGNILPQVQPGVTHHGKTPHHHESNLARSRLKAAKAELDRAVTEEKFEVAARLRDEIHALEQRIASENSAG